MSEKYNVVIGSATLRGALFIKNHLQDDRIKKVYLYISNSDEIALCNLSSVLNEKCRAVAEENDIYVIIGCVTDFLKILFGSAGLWEDNAEIISSVNGICDLLDAINENHIPNIDEIKKLTLIITKEMGNMCDTVSLSDCQFIDDTEFGDNDVHYYIGEFDVNIAYEKYLNLEKLYKFYWSLGPERYWLLNCNSDISNCVGIVLGMSYLQRGLNLEKLNYKTSCLAAPAQDIYFSAKMLEYALSISEHPNLKYCIFEVAPYSLWYDLSRSKEQGHRSIYYYPQIHDMHNYENADECIIEYKRLREIYDRICEDSLIMDEFLIHKTKNHLYEEKDIAVWAKREEQEKSISDIKKLFNKPYEETFTENVATLNNVVRMLSDMGVVTIFVTPPYPELFNANMNSEMVERTLDVLSGIKNQYSNVEVLNYLDDSDFDDYYFSDESHLNYWGSNLLSGKINNVLDALLVE